MFCVLINNYYITFLLQNLLEAKKAKTGYRAYDDEADLEAAALGYQRPVLSKYDDEIDKDKAEKQKGFFIGDEDAIEAKKFREMMVRKLFMFGKILLFIVVAIASVTV